MLRLFQKGGSSVGEDDKNLFLDAEKIIDVIKSFPLGNKIHFYPEFQKDIVLESIVIAYVINGYVIYSERDINSHKKDGKTVIVVNDEGNEKALKKVNSFYILLPNDEGEGGKMDYMRKAELDARGCFKRGNNITLLSSGDEQGVLNIDSIVLKNTRLKSGIYKNQEVAVLDIQLDSFAYEEQRQFYRIQTNIPIVVGFSLDGETYDCFIQDFTEKSLRIGYEADSVLPTLIKEDRRIILDINLKEQKKHFVLRGNVLRSDDKAAVILLAGILKNQKFENLALIDTLEFKASLLNHPHSSQQ